MLVRTYRHACCAQGQCGMRAGINRRTITACMKQAAISSEVIDPSIPGPLNALANNKKVEMTGQKNAIGNLRAPWRQRVMFRVTCQHEKYEADKGREKAKMKKEVNGE